MITLSAQLRRTLLSVACIAAAASASSATATSHDGHYYGVIDLGASFPTDANDSYHPSGWSSESFDHSFVGGLGVGMWWNPSFRTDIVASYRPNLDYKANGVIGVEQQWEQSISSAGIMVNGYYDIMPCAMLNPYITAGLGWAQNKGDHVKTTIANTVYKSTSSTTKNNFAWQVGAGVTYDLTSSWTADLAYRYVDLGEVRGKAIIDTSGATRDITSDLTTHEVFLRARYHF